MAKAAILDVLENTIGKYVQNLDAESLNVAVWAGKIELNSLKLDVDAVNREIARRAAEAPNLAIPFRVVSGSFSHLRLDVPWARITSRPVVMSLSGLKAIVEPYDHLTAKYDNSQKKKQHRAGTDSEKGITTTPSKKKRKKDERIIAVTYAEEGRQRANTVRRLAELDEVVDEIETTAGVDKSERNRSSSHGFKAKLVRRIIENLQVDIDGVDLEMRDQDCIAGLVLDHFSIVTTDKLGNRSFVDRATNSSNVEKSFIYKALQLKGLGIYCDEQNSGYRRLGTSQNEQKNFIISPLSFEAKLRQSDFIKCIDFPKFLVSANLPSISINLSRTQLELMNKVSRDILEKKHISRPLFPEYRPEEPLNSNTAKLWWKYAVRAVGRITRKRSWTEFFIAFQKRKQYIALFKRSQGSDCHWINQLTVEEEASLRRIEMDKTISVQGLMSWRNIAEAQLEMERKKYEAILSTRYKRSPRKSFFGFRSSVSGKSEDSLSPSDNDEPPISLSLSELKELENIAMEDYYKGNELSSDSILCDVNFHLGSFSVELVTFASRPLASFQMGSVSSSFKANADGSFVVDFQMSSLHVRDWITINTMFPYVVRSLEQQETSNASKGNIQNALGFKLKKARNGDQSLEACLVSFELVACDLLIKECKRFITFTEADFNGMVPTSRNPTLEYSVSGAVDLFYDANDPVGPGNLAIPKNIEIAPKVSDKFTSAFSDAWKSKLEKKIVWQVELDIRAPIIVLPKSCVDPTATVLVADLGRFRFAYGGGKLAKKVQQWFDSDKIEEDTTIDRCCLELSDFTFLIGTAGHRDWLKDMFTRDMLAKQSETIIEPINFSIDIGIENESAQRRCIIGVLPSISLNISFSQIERIMSVMLTWFNFVQSFKSNDNAPDSDFSTLICDEIIEEKVNETAKRNETKLNIQNKIYLSLALQRLSIQIANSKGESIEAHLALAETFTNLRPNGLSSIRIRMGYFWIIDNLDSELPRRQRLFVHSYLPKSAAFYAETDSYRILTDLEKEGIFEGTNNNASSLADVTIFKSNHVFESLLEDSIIVYHAKQHPVTKIDAKFSTLFVHWNPYAVRNIMAFLTDVSVFFEKVQTSAHQDIRTSRKQILRDHGTLNNNVSLLIFNAEMEAFEISLNSAKDDLPLFMMKMSEAKIRFISLKDEEENQEATVSVGDFRLESPAESKILQQYRTILGLASHVSSSLLCIEYKKGTLIVQSSDFKYIDKKETEMVIDVTLSPMRFVHIQAQILTLVEYLTEGVLGAVAKRVASSAAQAAYDLSQKKLIGKNVFYVKAAGFDFVLPQAVYSPEFLVLHMGNLLVHFTSFTNPGEGAAILTLEEVTMKCNRNEQIIETPIKLDIDVSLAPLNAPTLDEQATRAMLSTSRAKFIVTRHHYGQIMKTLELNIGEMNSFLRDEHNVTDETQKAYGFPTQSLTHGGAEEIIIKKRLYMTLKFEELAVVLCDETNDNPILSINAVETTILMKLLPHDDSMHVNATLHDLLVQDKRFSANNRYFSKLVRQIDSGAATSNHNVFKLEYYQSKIDEVQSVTIELGRPQLVFIPDLVVNVMEFFNRDDMLPKSIQIALEKSKSLELFDESFSITNTSDKQPKSKNMKFKLRTSDCRLVLLDMGAATSKSASVSQCTDVIVLQGQTEVNVELVKEIITGEVLRNSLEIHGENCQVYLAEGENLVSPIQVMNPTRFSAFFSTKIKDDEKIIDFSFVTLSAVHLILSMQNYSLLTAILSSNSEALSHRDKEIEQPQYSEEQELTNEVVKEIQLISSELEKCDFEPDFEEDEANVLFRGRTSTSSHLSTQSSMSKFNKRFISLKMTLPEITLVIVNDLQGLDDALFKVNTQSCVLGGDISLDDSTKHNTVFHVHANTNILADYFDSHTKLWEPFLLKQWEIDFKASRIKKKGSSRLTTTLDIESHPCQLSFSEQFIISLRGAASMWSLYSSTTRQAMEILSQMSKNERDISFASAKASYSARVMTTTMPYGIENRTGFPITFDVTRGKQDAPNNDLTFFQFPLPHGDGIGGFRSYGQDCIMNKSIDIFIDGTCIHFDHLDHELNRERRVHKLSGSRFVFSEVIKSGKATVILLQSFMTLINQTSLNFTVVLNVDQSLETVGISHGAQSGTTYSNYHKLGISAAALQKAYQSYDRNRENVFIQLSYNDYGPQLAGKIELPPFDAYRRMGQSKSRIRTFEVAFSAAKLQSGKEQIEKLILKVICKVTMIGNAPLMELFIQPRMLLQNNMRINIFTKTLMPHVYKRGIIGNDSANDGTNVFRLEPYDTLEIFSPGKSCIFAFKCADIPVGHLKSDWNRPGWIEIPLTISAQMECRINCLFPLKKSVETEYNVQGGSSFFVTEILTTTEETTAIASQTDIPGMMIPKPRVVTVNMENLGVDHTGDFLFEQCTSTKHVFTLFSFSSSFQYQRITLLPDVEKRIRLLQLSTEKRSRPFCIEDIAFANGGIESTPIYWDDSSESGFYAYKKLSFNSESENSIDNQLEIHIIPAIIIYNSSDDSIQVSYSGQQLYLESGKMSPIHQSWGENGLNLFIGFSSLGCATGPINISKTGLLVSIVKATSTGAPVGSVAIQTIIGGKDSRHVIKISPVKHGNITDADTQNLSTTSSLFQNDLLRFRIRWSQLDITFLDTSKQRNSEKTDIEKMELTKTSNQKQNTKNSYYAKVAQLVFSRFTVDYQKVFKDDIISATMKKRSEGRSQFATIIQQIHLRDFTEVGTGTTVLASTSKTNNPNNFVELYLRSRDNSSVAAVSNIDLVQLKLANNGEVSDNIILRTSEAFLWNLFDIASRTKDASKVFATVDTDITWDAENETFVVKAIEKYTDEVDDEANGNYSIPRNITVYAIKKASVLPTTFQVSFKRQPQTARYEKVRNVQGAKVFDYFTKRLNFTIDSARLKFSGFQVENVKGPPDRIIEIVTAFYVHQMKSKIFTLLTSTSIDEWYKLSGRDDGEKGYIEGDLLRTAGNLSGKSAGYLVKKVGQSINYGLTAGTAEVGNGIQNVTEAMGVGVVGAGMNSVISGIGGGVGSTVQGVGEGGSKIIKGAGKGVGQVVGGVSGGIMLTVKGLGKGVVEGDGQAVLTGLGDGAVSIGNGLLKGGESVVTGVGDGVLAVGQGLFKGVKNIGMGLGGAVTGKPPKPKEKDSASQSTKNKNVNRRRHH